MAADRDCADSLDAAAGAAEMVKLSWFDPESLRRQYKVIRTETRRTIPGHILIADARTGMCLLETWPGVRQEYGLGPGGLAIVRR
jgi:hypothetical protein